LQSRNFKQCAATRAIESARLSTTRVRAQTRREIAGAVVIAVATSSEDESALNADRGTPFPN